MCEQWYVGAGRFTWEVGFGADDEMRSSQMIECGKDLWGVEGWIQWNLHTLSAVSF